MKLFNKNKEPDTKTEKNNHQELTTKGIFAFNTSFSVIKSLFYFFIVVLMLLGSLGVGMGLGYFAFLVSDTPVPNKAELSDKIHDVSLISNITFNNGDNIAEIRSDILRTSIASDKMSPLVKKALISTEDENFKKHNGVVPKAVARALIADATGLGGASGGSTITQQLVKQQVLTSETTFKRKANEILLALRLEKFFSKDEIISAYLNVSPFGRNNKGQNIAGVEEAAQGIFNTTASDLTLPQAAFIAGLPQSPIIYSPYTNTGEIKEDQSLGLKRKNQVLFNMYREGYIKKKKYEEAINYDLTQDFKTTEAVENIRNDFLYQTVHQETIDLLMPYFYEKDGLSKKEISENNSLYNKYSEITERELRLNGLTVKTTIDKDIYNEMQAAEQNVGWRLDDGRERMIENGSVLMENSTGRVLGFIGGRDYNINQNNHAFQTRRSPGSTIKPLLAYAPAIDIGLIGSESKLSNYSRDYREGDVLRNYGGLESSGFKTVREALKESDNVPVVELYQKLLEEIDPKKDYYDKMDMKMKAKEFNYESIPVGGTDDGPTVFEQTNAFATLANKGEFNKGYVIESITDHDGKVIYEHKAKPVQVYSPETASVMNDMMRDVVNSGTGKHAKDYLTDLNKQVGKADWVGKTGTSQEAKDYWFIASTPNITLSSWIGYDDGTPMYDNWDDRNKEMWASIAEAAYSTYPEIFKVNEKFKLDSDVKKEDVSSFTGQKMGTVDIEGTKRKVPGKKVTSLWAKNGPEESKFEFGIGATEEQYREIWKTPESYGNLPTSDTKQKR
ncbi:transglycosylase domain-containing protein [Vagococcus intermedius]|uniref:Penicillin-binding protein n=1 Tax=Vagococcus intermedius TaxID=2991418 RepID=A0AAF0CW22_9ENTE|nr:transglycosylase domain-containing protein [Vagococcus intermedius]WEG74045.1 penicillin-binding protein [Vagococcus intermedius]WEG76125.1 penicillin-binding protein [Vagococcus intermedius]